MKLSNAIVLALVLLAQPALALELTEMQQLAVGNREVIKKFMTNMEKSKQDVVAARSGYYPAVDLSYTMVSLDEATTTEAEENSIFTGAVSLNLFAGFRDKYSIKSAHLQNEVQQHYYNGTLQDIQLNVALRYLDVYERKANLKVAQDAYTTLEKLYQDGINRLDVGLIGQNELLKFKVDLDNADITVKRANADLSKSIHLLAREIGTDLTLSQLDFADFDGRPTLGNAQESEQTMLGRRSEIKALEKMADSAGFQIKAQQAAYYPQVNLVGSYSYYDDDFIGGNGNVGEDELRGQVVMSMSLFNGFARESAVTKAKLDARALRYDLKELQDSLTTELANLFIDFEVNLANVSVAEENIKHAEENLRITQLKYDEGLQRESELLDAITSLSRAQYNYVSVIKTVFLNHFMIQRMTEGFAATATATPPQG